MFGRILSLCVLFSSFPSGGGAALPPPERMYVFGDSYSDTGAGYIDGNGPTAVARLAERLNIHLLPANASNAGNHSLNFAVSGAGTGSGSGRRAKGALLGLGMRNQVDDFASRVQSHVISFPPERTLFFIAGGLNDKRLPSEQTVANLEGEIRTLHGLGARRFLIARLPVAIPAFSEVGRRLNPALDRIPADIRAEFPDVSIAMSDWGPYMDEVMREPARYGIANTTDACAGREIFDEDAKPCATPEAYYYYHAGHPSAAVHKVVGEKLYQALMNSAADEPARRQLFNGKNLTGWSRIPRHEGAPANEPPGFRIENGILVSLPDSPEDDLWYTPEKFGNTTIRMVYKVSDPRANSGLFIRIPDRPKSEDDAINRGIEVQIDESSDDWHCTGVLYSMTKAIARPYKPAGEWNTLEIRLAGPRTVVTLNGTVVTDYDGTSPVPPKNGRYEPDRGPRPDSGYIAVQHHGGNATVWFREISVASQKQR